MIGCLMVDHPTVSPLSKCKMLRASFYAEDYEIEVLSQARVMVIVYNADQYDIWQAAGMFEAAGIKTGYGFAQSKGEAIADALKHLENDMHEEIVPQV
ncbi:hypothetical protein JNUCC1_02558 [Lentibacillus sp. JNUCC-1]|uniref:hypothetical protein n=1 Tax=Lentibacillus sp. JNUCC-1 TaxID=2654513 RepID=UPI0012E815A5|nr:hypothetical protein [Lentibacillus sp. JNUCC-1]MUV38704.1 hypothetical protein [Lentibacillus sp. JNUCC-1]